MSIKTKTLNVHADSPDLRDRIYSPTLRLLGKTYNAEPFADELWASRIKDQGQTSACTGFALSSLVEALVSKASSAGEKRDEKPALDALETSASTKLERANPVQADVWP